MKKHTYIAIAVVLSFFSILVPQHSNAAIDGFIRITSPNGGEVYTEGDTVTIRWESSSNIDKVTIGYSSCPSCLDWIAFTAPNTGSYTWKVNVGNTINTQFVIDITGWETGKGSTTDRSDANFTVYQNPPLFTSTPIKTPTPTQQVQQTQPPAATSAYTPAPTPTRSASPLPAPTVNSITDVKLNQALFYFEGSETTRLSDIKDPTHVEDFTLDYRGFGTIVWTEPIDLSTPQAISAIQNLNREVEYGESYFFIYYEFWIIWRVPVEITFDNGNYVAPPTVLKDGKPVQSQDIKLANNHVTVTAKDAGKYTVQNAIKLDKSDTSVSDTNYMVHGTVSDPSAKVQLTLNGQPIDSLINVDPKTGAFEKAVSLILGNNAIAATATSTHGPVTPDDLSLNYSNRSVLLWIIIVLLIIALLALAYLFWRHRVALVKTW